LSVQVLKLRDRRFDQLPGAAGSYSFFFGEQIVCPLVVLDGVPRGEHFHRLIPRYHGIPEERLRKASY
jgi:hypothetical protein